MKKEPKNEIETLRDNSAMLGQIAGVVMDYCSPTDTTLDGVKALLAEMQDERRWANHYCRKLVDARRLGYLPDGFTF